MNSLPENKEFKRLCSHKMFPGLHGHDHLRFMVELKRKGIWPVFTPIPIQFRSNQVDIDGRLKCLTEYRDIARKKITDQFQVGEPKEMEILDEITGILLG